MPDHLSIRRPATSRGRIVTPAKSAHDWRCICCGKLLGIHRDGQMHLSFARGHEYLVSYPATATCRGCGTLNQVTGPAR